jgi:tRNA threonylcarbamoyladenosine biosynthesis protein TsaE
MRSKYLTKSPSQTKKLGRILAREILKTKNLKQAFVLGLEGDLGGGKTCFLQGFAKGLGIKTKITSPTFVIMRRYKIQNTRYKIQDFYHIDCYRIKKPKEILTLGFKEIISNPRNIVAVEWADRIKKILPQNSLLFRFKFVNKTSREIVIEFKE